MAVKKINYTQNDKAIVNVLKGAPEGMTIAEMNEATGLKLVSGNIVSAMKKGLIEVIGEKEVIKQSKAKIATYEFVTAEPQKKEDGKAYNYTDKEKAILAAASDIEGAFTLADLSEKMGLKLSSGNINALVIKGNIAKGEPKDVLRPSKSSVNVYGFVADIPNEA